jgi:acetoin utilization deacetylase AcuC-like enzyme
VARLGRRRRRRRCLQRLYAETRHEPAHAVFDSRPPRLVLIRFQRTITAGTWTAAYAATQVALTAADLLSSGESSAFALCRPPGHHASRAYFGGYCYLNNAAIATQLLLDRGLKRAAILDVDFHHGNGTQSIFYERNDVLFASIHGDPDEEYPYFSGHADETGTGPGTGCNLNFPLPPGTGPDRWLDALDAALSRIRSYGAEAIVVSLGVDTSSTTRSRASSCDRMTTCASGKRSARCACPPSSSWRAAMRSRRSA